MLAYKGHIFFDGAGQCGCCVGDARVVSVDPTGTKKLRTAFNSMLAIKWRGMKALTRQVIVQQDLLTMGAKGLMQIANPTVQGGATKTQMFQRWYDYIAQTQVLQGDGSWMREYIRRGYEAGVAFAQAEVGNYVSKLAGDRQETIFQLAVVELQGIIEATSQQAVRAVAFGLLHGQRPNRIARAIADVIDKTGVTRSTALVELIVVKAFGEGTLDTYESAGVRRVGLLPETVLARRTTDARRRITPSGPAGTRSRGETPGLRTIQRIRKQERELEGAVPGGLVNVETAGDDRVCPVCEKISNRGPYRINKARQLIPAHPRCRCVFIPAKSTNDMVDVIRELPNGKFRLYSHTGKNLGTFNSREAAEKHEREVKMFKHMKGS